MSAGLVILNFLAKPWYYRLVNRSAKKGATVEALTCVEAQINTLNALTWQVADGQECYGLMQDIVLPGKRIAPMVNAQGVSAPRLTYQVLDTNGSPTKFAASYLDAVQVKISCHSKEYEQAVKIMQEVRVLFERYQGVLAGVKVQSVDFVTDRDTFSESADLVGVSHDYNIRLERNGGY